MKKRLVVVFMMAVLFCAYSLWASSYRFDSVAGYDATIKMLEKQLKELKTEKRDFERKSEKTIFVSIWALWKAGEELEYIEPTRVEYYDDDDEIMYLINISTITTTSICPQNFTKWLQRAQEIDKKLSKGVKDGKSKN